MEEKLGVTALVRSNKGVELTEEGKIINDYANEILSTYNRLIQELVNHFGKENLTWEKIIKI